MTIDLCYGCQLEWGDKIEKPSGERSLCEVCLKDRKVSSVPKYSGWGEY